MAKIFVNEDEYIAILNDELQKHPDFKEGMKIIGYPIGKSGKNLTGYTSEGPGFMPGIVADVANIVHQKYEYRPN